MHVLQSFAPVWQGLVGRMNYETVMDASQDPATLKLILGRVPRRSEQMNQYGVRMAGLFDSQSVRRAKPPSACRPCV